MGNSSSSRSKPKGPSQADLRNILASQNEAARLGEQSRRYNWQIQNDLWENDLQNKQKELQGLQNRFNQVSAMGGHYVYDKDKYNQDIASIQKNIADNPWEWNFATNYSGKVAGYDVKDDPAFRAAEEAKNRVIMDKFNQLQAAREAEIQKSAEEEQAKIQQGLQNSKNFALTGASTEINPEKQVDYKNPTKIFPQVGVSGIQMNKKPFNITQTNSLDDSQNRLGNFVKNLVNQSNKLTT